MRNESRIFITLVVLALLLTLFSFSSKAEQRFGIGGKLVGEVPAAIGSLTFDQFGIEVGGGMRSINSSYSDYYGEYTYDLSLTYYLANGRYLFPMNQVRPYVGGGMVGLTATATVDYDGTEETLSGGTNGFDVFVGLEVPLNRFGFPLTIFGGINYLGFENLTFEYEGETFSFPLGMSGSSFHAGLKFEF